MLVSPIDFSQYGQPTFFRQFLPPDLPKFVVDVGAHDGIDGSNSRELILEGWTGVLIEPLPAAFAQLEKNYRGIKHVALLPYACSNSEGTAILHISRDGASGQSSSLCEDDTWRHNHGGGEIPVPVYRLTTLLAGAGCPSQFPLLLIDAEGVDLEVLQGLDFDRFRPAVICTELYLANPGKERRKHELLASLGYQLRSSIGSDTIWTCSKLVGDRSWPQAALYQGPGIPKPFAELPLGGEAIAYLDTLLHHSGMLTASGWAVAPDRSIPPTVFVGLRSTPDSTDFVQSRRHPRADVARHFNDESLLFTGFTASWQVPDQTASLQFDIIQCTDRMRYENAIERSAPAK